MDGRGTVRRFSKEKVGCVRAPIFCIPMRSDLSCRSRPVPSRSCLTSCNDGARCPCRPFSTEWLHPVLARFRSERSHSCDEWTLLQRSKISSVLRGSQNMSSYSPVILLGHGHQLFTVFPNCKMSENDFQLWSAGSQFRVAQKICPSQNRLSTWWWKKYIK